jgi:hypothetical protein
MANLNGVLPELQAAYNALTDAGKRHLITFRVADFGGLRTQADTNRILQYREDDYAAARRAGTISADTTIQRFRPISAFGHSYHNYGAAFDVLITSKPAGLSDLQAKRVLANEATALGLRWGGTFPNPDTPHFELAIPLEEAARRYAAATGTTVAGGDYVAFDEGSGVLDDSGAVDDPFGGSDVATWGNLDPGQDTTVMIWAGLAIVAGLIYAVRRRYLGG